MTHGSGLARSARGEPSTVGYTPPRPSGVEDAVLLVPKEEFVDEQRDGGEAGREA